MSTSANVMWYKVYKDNRLVAEYRQNMLCKNTVREKLAQHCPTQDYELGLRWPDEDEVDHHTSRVKLSDFFDSKINIFADLWID